MSVAAADNAIITTDEYAAIFGTINGIDKYQALINQASSRISLYTHRTLKSNTYSGATALILDGHGRASIVAPHYPISTIDHLYVDSDRLFESDSEIDEDDYRFDPETGIITLYDDLFPDVLGCIKLECTAGYLTTDPRWQVLQSACLETVRWLDGRYGAAGGVGLRSQSNADGGSTTWETDLPINIKSLLEDFVEVRL